MTALFHGQNHRAEAPPFMSSVTQKPSVTGQAVMMLISQG